VPVHRGPAARAAAIAPFEVMEVLDLANRLEAGGADVIHLEVGEPDFPTPEPVVEAARDALASRPMRYTSALGMPELREAVSRHYADRFGAHVPPGRIAITSGSSAALLLALGATVDPDEEVLLGDPGYPCNRHFASFVGASPVLVPTGPRTAYQVSADALAAAWTPRTAGVIAASPSNPTGTMVPDEEWGRIADLCADRRGVLVADEIYQGLVYGREPHTVLRRRDDVLVVNSFSKYFQMTGWRIGWLVVPDRLIRDVEKLAQNLFICPPTPAQHAALAAFDPRTTAVLEERRAAFARRRDVLLDLLPSVGFAVRAVPDGAFYVYCDTSAVAPDSFALARRILEEAHVALTPGRDFGVAAPERHVRIAYTQTEERLREAVGRIARVVGAG
jgi:aspartate/methionine/tyrosine aminotransferase